MVPFCGGGENPQKIKHTETLVKSGRNDIMGKTAWDDKKCIGKARKKNGKKLLQKKPNTPNDAITQSQ